MNNWFKISDKASEKVIRPVGDMTADHAEALRAALLSTLAPPCPAICFDLSDVRDIDTAALHILVVFSRMAQHRFPGMLLKIVHSTPDIANLFRMTRMDEVFRIS